MAKHFGIVRRDMEVRMPGARGYARRTCTDIK